MHISVYLEIMFLFMFGGVAGGQGFSIIVTLLELILGLLLRLL